MKVQDHLNSLRNSETDAILEDVKVAENLMKDARNSKTVGGASRKPPCVFNVPLQLKSTQYSIEIVFHYILIVYFRSLNLTGHRPFYGCSCLFCTYMTPLPPACAQLLPNLYHLGVASREEVNGASVGPIQEKLESMAGEVARVMDEQLQVGSTSRSKVKVQL